MLTKKQNELLHFIHGRVTESGITPSYDEMKVALSLASKSGIHRLVGALEERGFIRRLKNRARALEVIRLPEHAPATHRVQSGFTPRVIEGSLGRDDAPSAPSDVTDVPVDEQAVSVPLMGRIAAGVPISAIQNVTRQVSVPRGMIGHGRHFALEVRGQSMSEAGIVDGDVVVIRERDTASDGEIVVALVDGEEATLKRFKRRGKEIVLEAANPEFADRSFASDRVKVQGHLVGLIRTYH